MSVPAIAGGDAIPAKAAPPIDLTDQYGKKIDLAKLKGHTVLVAFLYTHCTDLCPIVAGKVHTAYAGLLEVRTADLPRRLRRPRPRHPAERRRIQQAPPHDR